VRKDPCPRGPVLFPQLLDYLLIVLHSVNIALLYLLLCFAFAVRSLVVDGVSAPLVKVVHRSVDKMGDTVFSQLLHVLPSSEASAPHRPAGLY
jgi:hypothetical protein